MRRLLSRWLVWGMQAMCGRHHWAIFQVFDDTRPYTLRTRCLWCGVIQDWVHR